MQDKREHPRYFKRLAVELEHGGMHLWGYVNNISDGGLETWTAKRFPVGAQLVTRVQLDEDRVYYYLSQVRWVRPARSTHIMPWKIRMGLQFLARDMYHERLIRRCFHEEERRASERLTARIPVTWMESESPMELLTTDISESGAFLLLVSDHLPQLDQSVSLRFHHPTQSEEAALQARVVYQRAPSWAERLGLEPGFAVTFGDTDDDNRQAWQEILSYARSNPPELPRQIRHPGQDVG